MSPLTGTQALPGDQFEEVAANQPTGLAGTIGVRILDNVGTTVDPRRTAGIAEEPAASGIYVVVLTAPSTPGQYSIVWDTDPAGVLSPTNTTVHALTVTPTGITPASESMLCSLWVDPATVTCNGEAVDAVYVEAANELLYVQSGYQYPGVCVTTARPCQPDYGCYADGCFRCERPYNTVKLYHPLIDVLSVEIDGAQIDPAGYRIYDRAYLQRVDGVWPWQNLALPPGEVGTWQVTFAHGATPPLSGAAAVRSLACHLAAGDGGSCALPAHVRSLTRQGINQQFAEEVVQGLALGPVAAFLDTAGRGPATVWTPDLPQEPAEVL